MPRVVSKHLFNFQLDGLLDNDVAALIQKQKDDADGDLWDMDEWHKLFTSDEMPEVDRANKLRELTRAPLEAIYSNPDVLARVEKCNHSKFVVPPSYGNDFAVPVLVHTPKRIADQPKKVAVIYAHGGGAVVADAELYKAPCSFHAEAAGVVFFSVDYRLAPEAKAPKGVTDFYCAIKYIVENAESFGIDPDRIAMAGESGGGYICFGAMVMLAQKNEGHLVKMAMPIIPMCSDICFSDSASMPKEERENAIMMRGFWKMIAQDINKRDDPLLFPDKASDELLEKMPPTIVFELEFDMFITEATRLARRLREAGRLLELIIIPGLRHIDWELAVLGTIERSKLYMDTFKQAIDEYLKK